MGLRYLLVCGLFFFFFKQKTAYEMRISDWSSDVCSSDLSHDMVDRARWVDPGMRERGLDQADRLAAHLAQVAVVLVDPAEELQVDAGWRVLDHGPRGRRVLQHAVDVRVGLQQIGRAHV